MSLLEDPPLLNAMLNALSGVSLLTGFFFIRRKMVYAHRLSMLTAFGASILFLISYLAYHAKVGSVHFPGEGPIQAIYLTILATHTALAVVIVPLALVTLTLARRGRFDAHKRWARVTFPLWLYVSTTGVIIYWMLYRSQWGIRAW